MTGKFFLFCDHKHLENIVLLLSYTILPCYLVVLSVYTYLFPLKMCTVHTGHHRASRILEDNCPKTPHHSVIVNSTLRSHVKYLNIFTMTPEIPEHKAIPAATDALVAWPLEHLYLQEWLTVLTLFGHCPGGALGQVSYGGVQLWGPNPYPILGKAGLRKHTLF